MTPLAMPPKPPKGPGNTPRLVLILTPAWAEPLP
jgi:hypothetical protein